MRGSTFAETVMRTSADGFAGRPAFLRADFGMSKSVELAKSIAIAFYTVRNGLPYV